MTRPIDTAGAPRWRYLSKDKSSGRQRHSRYSKSYGLQDFRSHCSPVYFEKDGAQDCQESKTHLLQCYQRTLNTEVSTCYVATRMATSGISLYLCRGRLSVLYLYTKPYFTTLLYAFSIVRPSTSYLETSRTICARLFGCHNTLPRDMIVAQISEPMFRDRRTGLLDQSKTGLQFLVIRFCLCLKLASWPLHWCRSLHGSLHTSNTSMRDLGYSRIGKSSLSLSTTGTWGMAIFSGLRESNERAHSTS